MDTELLIIGGERRPASEGRSFAVLAPGTGEPLAEVAEASAADARRAVEIAVRAFEDGPWPKLSATARGRVLLRTSVLGPSGRAALGGPSGWPRASGPGS